MHISLQAVSASTTTSEMTEKHQQRLDRIRHLAQSYRFVRWMTIQLSKLKRQYCPRCGWFTKFTDVVKEDQQHNPDGTIAVAMSCSCKKCKFTITHCIRFACLIEGNKVTGQDLEGGEEISFNE